MNTCDGTNQAKGQSQFYSIYYYYCRFAPPTWPPGQLGQLARSARAPTGEQRAPATLQLLEAAQPTMQLYAPAMSGSVGQSSNRLRVLRAP